MDGVDKMNIEKLLSNPSECEYRVMLREFFEYDVPLKCPYKSMLKAFYNNLLKKERDKDSGLI